MSKLYRGLQLSLVVSAMLCCATGGFAAEMNPITGHPVIDAPALLDWPYDDGILLPNLNDPTWCVPDRGVSSTQSFVAASMLFRFFLPTICPLLYVFHRVNIWSCTLLAGGSSGKPSQMLPVHSFPFCRVAPERGRALREKHYAARNYGGPVGWRAGT